MEVAGLVIGVVGVLPVIVEVIEGYRMIMEVAQVKHDMVSMGRDLSTETVILQNTYERLLDGIVPAWEVGTLTKMEPQTSKWRSYDEQIRGRLSRSFDDFQRRAEDIQAAVAELQQKLAISSNGESRMKSWSSIMFEIRLGTRFTLRKKDYVDTIGRIRHGNDLLKRLVDHNATFEPIRRSRSQSERARATRNLTKGLYFAIKDAMGCDCGTHGLGLQLAEKQTFEFVGEGEDMSGKSPHFDIILGRTPDKPIQYWDELKVHCNTNHLSATVPSHVSLQPWETSPSTHSNVHIPMPRKRKAPVLLNLWTKVRLRDNEVETSGSENKELGKKVRFSMPAPSQMADKMHTSTTIPLAPGALQAHSGRPSPIVNLCRILHKGRTITNDFIGCITSNVSTSFDLYHRDYQAATVNLPRTVTLREALLGKEVGLRDLGVSERLNIAVALSFGVLHLCSTPWLKQVVTLDDIIFLLREQIPSNLCDFGRNLSGPFLVNQLTNTANINVSSNSDRRPVNFHVLSLGMLLTHVIAGCPVPEIEVEEHMSKELLSSGRASALEKIETCDDASDEYVEAVSWCLNNSFTFATLEAENLRQSFQDAVIARLEGDLDHLSLK